MPAFLRVIARPDYHEVLWDIAQELGVELRLGSEAEEIDFDGPSVRLTTGEVVQGDVIVGADGKLRLPVVDTAIICWITA